MTSSSRLLFAGLRGPLRKPLWNRYRSYDDLIASGRPVCKDQGGSLLQRSCSDGEGTGSLAGRGEAPGIGKRHRAADRQETPTAIERGRQTILPLYAKGLTADEIPCTVCREGPCVHCTEIYGGRGLERGHRGDRQRRERISRIADKVIEEMQVWSARLVERRVRRDLHRGTSRWVR